jgi:hypothetical protein
MKVGGIEKAVAKVTHEKMTAEIAMKWFSHKRVASYLVVHIV